MTVPKPDDDQGGSGCVYATPYYLAHQADWHGVECAGGQDTEMPHSCTAHADVVREMRGDTDAALQAALR
jgi:hypothetical protein